jgi:hypothetical protein
MVYGCSSNVLLTLNDVALAPDTATGQTISFGAVISGVGSVRFDIEAVQSSPDFTGLAEVAFNTAVAQVPVPLPPSLVLTLGAAVALGLGCACDLRRVPSRVR